MTYNNKKRSLSLFMSFVFFLGCVAGLAFAIIYFYGNNKAPTGQQLEFVPGSTLSCIAESYSEICVSVYVDGPGNNDSFGSGVAVAAGGYIATNYHVIKNTAINPSNYSLSIFPNESDSGYSAKLLWFNKDLDLAIVQSDSDAIRDLNYGIMKDRVLFCEPSEKLKILEEVIVIGTPIDMELQNSVSDGKISSKSKRSRHTGTGTQISVYEDLIQHSAPINPGNSGGPLIDANGNIIGLNTLGYSDYINIGFSVPIWPIIEVIDKVVAANQNNTEHKTAKIGVNGYDSIMTKYIDSLSSLTEKGFKVTEYTGTPVDALKSDDIITSIEFEVFEEESYITKTSIIKTRNDLIYTLIRLSEGDEIKVNFKRGLISSSSNITLTT